MSGKVIFVPCLSHTCVSKLHAAYHNDLWYRAKVWEDWTWDQKTRRMIKKRKLMLVSLFRKRSGETTCVCHCTAGMTNLYHWLEKDNVWVLIGKWSVSFRSQLYDCILLNSPTHLEKNAFRLTHAHISSPRVVTLALCVCPDLCDRLGFALH